MDGGHAENAWSSFLSRRTLRPNNNERHSPMSDKPDEHPEKKLSDEDQARVDKYLRSGANKVERKPFRPLLLLLVIVGVLTLLSLLSIFIARTKGVV